MSTETDSPETSVQAAVDGPLDVRGLLTGARILIIGGTGFLGKVWLSMLLDRFPELEHVYLVVRPKTGLDSEARFWSEVAGSGAFDPLRLRYPGPQYEEFLRAKITPIPGDVSREFAGLPEDLRDKLRGTLTALVNAAGVVDFNPPLDDALNVNAFGMQSLVALARDLGDGDEGIPFLHTSTCYVAGMRTGQVEEVHPLEFPFPRADELDRSHWDPDREIAECVDVVESVRHRTNDAFRQSDFLDEAKRNLVDRGEPARGSALDDELAKVRRRYEAGQLAEAGRERANFWGWPNTYTYTKSIGEQVLADSGLRFAIVRPAVIESSRTFPRVGWNEGITTSAPIMYLAMKGITGVPANADSVLDVVPADTVAAGMVLALAELIDNSHRPVYQLGTSDSNPLEMYRLIELTGLYKRRKFKGKAGGNPLFNWLQANYQTVPVGVPRWRGIGPGATRDRVQGLSGLLKKAGAQVRVLAPAVAPATKVLDGIGNTMNLTDKVVDQYVPFTATHNYVFSCRNTRRALRRVPQDQRESIPWDPETIDWRQYWLEVHTPGVEKLVWPLIEDRIKRPRKALRRHDDLLAFLDEIADRHGHAPALMIRHPDGFARVTFVELRERASATAQRLLTAGVKHGDRVLLSGRNHPDWVVAFFGILRAGAVVVPLDPAMEPADASAIEDKAQARLAVLDGEAESNFGSGLDVTRLDLTETTAGGGSFGRLPAAGISGEDVASILFTSGTTGEPKGVMLTHANFTSLLASLARVFELTEDDRVLSVLPLHHTFEFTCGLLLPLSRGTRVVYLDEITGEKLSSTLSDARITAMVGVPALWQLLERRMVARVAERGALFQTVFDAGLELNRWLGRAAGIDAGKLLFGTVHKGLGGNIRLLISGGAALPAETHRFFSGLGLHLAEGYGLTEAAPVLTAAVPRPGSRAGNVGRPVPGVELRIAEPDDQGVGEVLARGPNVMTGYFRNEEATRAALDDDGWLHTGDLGRLDHKGRLVVVGRAKDVVVTATGENVYLDDVEAKLGTIPFVSELSLVGLPDGQGGELLGLLAVPASASEHGRARDQIRKACGRLPTGQRPAVIHLVDADLPRTATRKVKRREVADILERIHAAAQSAKALPQVGAGAGQSPVRSAIATVAGVDPASLSASTRIGDELQFDSLMWVELGAALDELPGGQPPLEALSRCETIAEVEALLNAPVAPPPPEADASRPRTPFRFPAPVVGPLRKLLRSGQRNVYERMLDVRVTGRAFIPKNRRVLVVSNHCSHIDMGLVKTALGDYGEQMVALAAQDYFFEGNDLWVAYFEQLTNLKPLARGTSYRQSMRQAIESVSDGNVVLIFPEGGRQADGVLKDFKPLVGKLVLETKTDILPLYLWGTHEALPKGAGIPRGRKVGVKIGPPIEFADLERVTAGQKPSEASRTVAQVLHAAVRDLRDGSVLDLKSLESWNPDATEEVSDPVADLFAEIRDRFQPEAPTEAMSWYFSLGGDDGRWTVLVEPGTCSIQRGRPPGGAADCVVKTNPDLWARMVREAHVPEVSEFVGGVIKTSDLDKLMAFAQVFRLGPLDVEGDPQAAGGTA